MDVVQGCCSCSGSPHLSCLASPMSWVNLFFMPSAFVVLRKVNVSDAPIGISTVLVMPRKLRFSGEVSLHSMWRRSFNMQCAEKIVGVRHAMVTFKSLRVAGCRRRSLRHHSHPKFRSSIGVASPSGVFGSQRCLQISIFSAFFLQLSSQRSSQQCSQLQWC